jgi:hypothetical protein
MLGSLHENTLPRHFFLSLYLNEYLGRRRLSRFEIPLQLEINEMNENSPFLRLSDDDDTVEDIEPLLDDGETEFQHTSSSSSSSSSRKTSQRHQRLALGVTAFSALLFIFSVMFYGVYHFLGLVVTDRACLRIMSAYSELLLFAGNLLLLLSHIPRFLVILTRAKGPAKSAVSYRMVTYDAEHEDPYVDKPSLVLEEAWKKLWYCMYALDYRLKRKVSKLMTDFANECYY